MSLETPNLNKEGPKVTVWGSLLFVSMCLCGGLTVVEGFISNRSLDEYDELRNQLEVAEFDINILELQITDISLSLQLIDLGIYFNKMGGAARYQSERFINTLLKPNEGE